MYRNCTYDPKNRVIHLFTWDKDGRRVRQELPFSPYLYLEDKKGDAKSIYGTSLKKKEFASSWERNKFVKESGIRRIFENLPPYQQFLIDNYYHNCESDEFSEHPLKICFLDIETPSNPNIAGGAFPKPELAEQVINLIVCYDSLTKKRTGFGLKKYTGGEKIVYYHCKSEHDLLKKFIGHFSSDFPDVLTTYNGANFDIPYLINRITFELGKEWADELSPVGRIYERINPNGKFGQSSKEYVIEGISCLDYYVMYQKFSMDKQESYKLDYIGEVEVGVNKVEYEGTLWDLAKDDWDRFVLYCIRDVDLLVRLDAKLDYISLLRFLAYTGLCSLENAIKTVPCMNGAIAIKARERGQCIPTFIKPVSDYKAPGGYVSDPKLGFSKNIVSFDANSLYPSVMISLNLSPETKLGKFEKVGDSYNIHHVSGRTFELTKDAFKEYLVAENAALSKSGHLFTQNKKGIIPEFLDNLYTKRKEMKGKMLEARKQGDKEAENKFNTIQYAYKIHLNSLYGYMLNKYAPVGDEDIGTSVTMTGQAAIKQSVKLYYDYLNSKLPDEELEESYIYSDTDSCVYSLNWVDKVGVSLMSGDVINPKFYSICDEIEKFINDGMSDWAKRILRSSDPRFVFKRETICDAGIFIGKKYYVLHLLDDEGTPTNKFKYKGVDVVKTTMPKAIKPYVKKIIETMVLTQDKTTTNELYLEAYKMFKQLGVESVYKNSGINNYEQYAKKCSEFTTCKGMPSHVKAAYYHDLLVDRLNLTSKYETFKSGEKVKMAYLKTPNKYGIDIIGFKSKYPPEFDEYLTIDYEKMFSKIFFAAIERFYDAVNWKLRKPNENVKIELEDFLS